MPSHFTSISTLYCVPSKLFCHWKHLIHFWGRYIYNQFIIIIQQQSTVNYTQAYQIKRIVTVRNKLINRTNKVKCCQFTCDWLPLNYENGLLCIGPVDKIPSSFSHIKNTLNVDQQEIRMNLHSILHRFTSSCYLSGLSVKKWVSNISLISFSCVIYCVPIIHFLAYWEIWPWFTAGVAYACVYYYLASFKSIFNNLCILCNKLSIWSMKTGVQAFMYTHLYPHKFRIVNCDWIHR